MSEIAEIMLMASILGFALLAVEVKRVIHGIVLICSMNALIAIVYVLLDSPFVAMFNILIYVGALAALFLITASLSGPPEVLEGGRVRILGLVVTAAVGIALLFLVLTEPFPMSQIGSSTGLVPPNFSDIMDSVSAFLWSERAPDLVAKAVVLVAATVCCVFILAKEED
jgi:NADH:ubiquinone oxidoreductase subunit 6 (subunit J)